MLLVLDDPSIGVVECVRGSLESDAMFDEVALRLLVVPLVHLIYSVHRIYRLSRGLSPPAASGGKGASSGPRHGRGFPRLAVALEHERDRGGARLGGDGVGDVE